MLRRENEKLELESKQRNDENNKYKMIRTLELVHGKYQYTLTDLQSVTLKLQHHQEEETAEAQAMKQTLKRDWILRKEKGNDELRFCQPCLIWHQTPGAKLGNLLRSPWVNGGVSVRKMDVKAKSKGKKPSHLWNDAYKDHESTQGHKKCVTLVKQQGTLNVFVREASEDGLKNRLKIAYQRQSKLRVNFRTRR